MEQQTGSKQDKDYVKAVYCHPAYLTSMQIRKEKEAAAAARTTEDLFGSTSESDTSTFHGFDEDDLEEPRSCRGRRSGRGSPTADKKGSC